MLDFIKEIPTQFWVIASTVVVVFMGVTAMLVRAKSAKKPATVKKIMIPPIAMSSGALMYVFPYFRLPLEHLMLTVIVGVLCSLILIKTSKFEIIEHDIYLKPSKAFIFVLVGLLIFRTVAKVYLGGTIHLGELGGIFFLLAFSMLLPWRLAMLVQFKKLEKQLKLA